ncbi:Essential protein Yae1, N terminal [Rhinocladiella similis]
MEHTRSRSPQSHTASLSPASTTVTTPDQSPGADEDIWDTSSDHGQHGVSDPAQGSTTDIETNRTQILSDLPQLRRQHMTDGYREGLAVGKAAVMQEGFDSGYPVGVEIGLRVGAIFGVLEGVVEGLKKLEGPAGPSSSRQSVSGSGTTIRVRGENGRAPRDAATSLSGTGTHNNANNIDLEDLVGGERERKGVESKNTTRVSAPLPDLKTVEKLYEEAKTELKISELMKNLDDAMVDRMGRLNVGKHDDHQASAKEKQVLPKEIDQVICRWEDIVLRSLAARLEQHEP